MTLATADVDDISNDVNKRVGAHDANGSGLCSVKPLNDDSCRSETQGRQLSDVGGSTSKGCGGCCDGGSDVEKVVTLIKTRLLRKGQSSSSDTMLEILEDCILFHNERIYIGALYRRHKCAIQVKCSTSTSVLYK